MANTTYTCHADILYHFLKQAENASTLHDLLVSGSDSILKAGSITPTVLKGADEQRRIGTPTNPTKLLACAIQRGKEVSQGQERYIHEAHIRLYDRGMGDELIKPAGDVVIALCDRLRGHHTEGLGAGLMSSSYEGRSGILWDNAYQVLYEVITFTGIIVRREG
jgi:hypothetical protein